MFKESPKKVSGGRRMIKYCKKCGDFIKEINIGTTKNPKYVEDCIRGYGNDVFCGYCASTCFFIDGEMLDFEEVRKLRKRRKRK